MAYKSWKCSRAARRSAVRFRFDVPPIRVLYKLLYLTPRIARSTAVVNSGFYRFIELFSRKTLVAPLGFLLE